MPQYLSPGVYVEEVPSAVQPVAGVGTSTAGFIGTMADEITIPVSKVINEVLGLGDSQDTTFELDQRPVLEGGAFQIRAGGVPVSGATLDSPNGGAAVATLTSAPGANVLVTGDYTVITSFRPAQVGEVKLCTNFAEFTKWFGSFSTDPNQSRLVHAVYGFFRNGGTRCYVVRADPNDVEGSALARFEAIDEIALVAAPGITDAAVTAAIVTHCQQTTGDRFAILDSPGVVKPGASTDPEAVQTDDDLDLTLLSLSNAANVLPDFSDHAAFYFPWIQVFDPARKIQDPAGDGRKYAPPSGHVAGIYARVDTQRGVHKAPANESVLGALGLKYNISKAQQDGLNPQGVNCIRDLNGNIRVWGARTLGGDSNGEWKYVSVRRLFLFLKESIDEGLQWVVFEPNDRALWAKITRNVTAFLTTVWRDGALFGATPQEAFYVKCDEETNPPELRDRGQVVTEIGVSIVRPAEFVIFRLSQWAGPEK